MCYVICNFMVWVVWACIYSYEMRIIMILFGLAANFQSIPYPSKDFRVIRG